MTLSFLRPAILAAVAVASLAGCGGKATFDIAGSVQGLQYPGLVLTEKKSGQIITINDVTKTTFSFPNTIEYGTEFEIVVTTQPPHQSCRWPGELGDSYTGSAGQQASINARLFCSLTPHTVGGSIKMAAGSTGSYVGLKLINGSNDLNPFAVTDAAQTAYVYPNIVFGVPYGITIFSQPTDPKVKCKLVPKGAFTNKTDEQVSGTMGDENLTIDVECTKQP
jgi:hypothetical protein